MTLLQALLLGIVEGITEFLPISSTGHLIVTAHMLGLPQTDILKSFEIAIQLGAIAAAVLVYWKTIIGNRYVWVTVAAAFIPTGIIGFLLHQVVKTYVLGNITVVLGALAVGGVILIIIEKLHHEEASSVTDLKDITLTQAVMIGIAQALALIPGVSRSAATIMCGMMIGIRRSAIVDFSFLLAIPTMLAATGFDLYQTGGLFSSQDIFALGVGFSASFFTALIAIYWLLSFIRTHSFTSFGVYRIALACVVWFFILG